MGKKRKKKEKPAILTIHRTWGCLNPCDRIVELKNRYNRRKNKKIIEKEQEN